MENINLLGIEGVAFLVIMCLLVGLIVKNTSLDNKWIPVICGVVGGVCGVLAMIGGMPDFPAHDYFNAIAIGIVSGLGSVGCHQIYKQLTGSDMYKDENDNEDTSVRRTVAENVEEVKREQAEQYERELEE